MTLEDWAEAQRQLPRLHVRQIWLIHPGEGYWDMSSRSTNLVFTLDLILEEEKRREEDSGAESAFCTEFRCWGGLARENRGWELWAS